MRGVRAIACFLVAFGLGACSSGQEEAGGWPVVRDILRGAITGETADGPEAEPPTILTRAALAGIEDPLLRARLESAEVTALLGRVEVNGPYATWQTQDDITLTLQGGRLVATRGLLKDLMEAAPPPLAPAHTVGRVHRYLGGDDRLVTMRFRCAISREGVTAIEVVERRHRTVHLRETCTSDDLAFQNDYWVEPSGAVRRSRQWVGPEVGYLSLERIID